MDWKWHYLKPVLIGHDEFQLVECWEKPMSNVESVQNRIKNAEEELRKAQEELKNLSVEEEKVYYIGSVIKYDGDELRILAAGSREIAFLPLDGNILCPVVNGQGRFIKVKNDCQVTRSELDAAGLKNYV